MPYVAYQSKHFIETSGPFKIAELDKETPACLFLKAGCWTNRLLKRKVEFQIFDSKTEAESFVEAAYANAGVRELEATMKAARAAAREADLQLSRAYKEVGAYTWKKEDNDV